MVWGEAESGTLAERYGECIHCFTFYPDPLKPSLGGKHSNVVTALNI